VTRNSRKTISWGTIAWPLQCLAILNERAWPHQQSCQAVSNSHEIQGSTTSGLSVSLVGKSVEMKPTNSFLLSHMKRNESCDRGQEHLRVVADFLSSVKLYQIGMKAKETEPFQSRAMPTWRELLSTELIWRTTLGGTLDWLRFARIKTSESDVECCWWSQPHCRLVWEESSCPLTISVDIEL